MTLLSFMPAKCWMAPEIPTATYKLRSDDLAGLAHLPVVRGIARVNRSTGCANGGAQLVCQLSRSSQSLFGDRHRDHRDNDASRGQLGAIRRCNLVFNPFDRPGLAAADMVSTEAEPPSPAASNVESGRRRPSSHRGFHRLDRVARIDRTLKRIRINNAGHVRDHHHIQQRRHARHHVFGVVVAGATMWS